MVPRKGKIFERTSKAIAPASRPFKFHHAAPYVLMALMALPANLALPGQQQPLQPPLVRPPLLGGNSIPDANDVMRMRESMGRKQSFEEANTERKRQIDADSAAMLKLAAELKAEVDKTSKDTLSLSVIRKADEIEHLAHNVKEKMKLVVGAN
jgi:hypothetical protein